MTNTPPQKSAIPISFVLCGLALIGLHAFAVYILPDIAPDHWAFLKRNWGFHFWIYYPKTLTILAYAIAIGLTIPAINNRCLHSLRHLLTQLFNSTQNKKHKQLFMVFAIAASWIIFWIFRQKYGLLGDGYVRASDVAKGQIISEGKGSLILLIWLHKGLAFWDDTGILTLQIFSVFWGGLYVYLIFKWADLVGTEIEEKALCFGLLFFLGSIQYFFGYIETYAPLPIFITGFALLGIQALQEKRLPLWCTLWIGLGAWMHILMALQIPALICLWGFYLYDRIEKTAPTSRPIWKPLGRLLSHSRISTGQTIFLLRPSAISRYRSPLCHIEFLAPLGMD